MDDDLITDDVLSPPKRINLPHKRTYRVEQFNPQTGVMREITLEAHRCINEPEQNAVAFFDYVNTPEGTIVEMHRLLFNVFDVEMVMRELGRSPLRVN